MEILIRKMEKDDISCRERGMDPCFYRKNGFVDCEHVLFMAKEM